MTLAGTHDLQLAYKTLDELVSKSSHVSLPRFVIHLFFLMIEFFSFLLNRYDKTRYHGRGDRADIETWPVTQGT